MPEHWLSYSNADQSILREDTRGLFWDGLVVPGTLATYYKQGVGGYVLSRRKPFVIDPRTPLLQPVTINRVVPRASHETLAAIHDPNVASVWAAGGEVELEWWTAERWEAAVDSVLDFETNFERDAADKVAKYDAMLSEIGLSLDQPIAGPDKLIPPYWAVTGVNDPWWTLSLAAIQRATSRTRKVMPVLCLSPPASPALFSELIEQLPSSITEVFCWRGRWDETDATAADVAGWVQKSSRGAARGMEVLNMYGGALSVYLTGLGLAGVSHGVGYSESRDERRLGQTGAPPIRYYVPRLRTFLPVPQAQQMMSKSAGISAGSSAQPRTPSPLLPPSGIT